MKVDPNEDPGEEMFGSGAGNTFRRRREGRRRSRDREDEDETKHGGRGGRRSPRVRSPGPDADMDRRTRAKVAEKRIENWERGQRRSPRDRGRIAHDTCTEVKDKTHATVTGLTIGITRKGATRVVAQILRTSARTRESAAPFVEKNGGTMTKERGQNHEG